MALRTAVSSLPKFITPDSTNAIDQLKTVASDRATEIVNATGTQGGIQNQINMQKTAIDLAIKVLEVSYNIVCKQLTETFNKRLAFDKERLAGVSAFLLPTNKEEGHYSNEEWVIKGYIELAQHNPLFFDYLGINEGELLEKKSCKYYSVLPFYRMSEEIHHPIGSAKPLEKQRNSINLFFKSAVPEILSHIDIHFQTDYKIVAFVESWIHDHNYLNNLRAPRFIIMSLCNLLWNLQHPVDSHTGVPISLIQAKKLCNEVLLFINQILDEDMPPHLGRIGKIHNELLSFVQKIEIQVKELYNAFIDEIINEINIEDVTNSAHHVLRIMDKSIYKLLYKTTNVISQKTEPDEKAAEDIAYLINLLNQLININPNIIEIFKDFILCIPLNAQKFLLPKTLSPIQVINEIPTTVVDALVIFAHLDTKPRHILFTRLELSAKDSAKEFARNLRLLKSKFIDPLKKFHRNDVNRPLFEDNQEIANQSARCFIPLITLIIEDFRVDVDRRLTEEEIKYYADAEHNFFNGSEQTQKINASATVPYNYYYWKLSNYLTIGDKRISSKIDLFPIRQYRITQVTVLLDAIAELITKYQSFLQDLTFQEFLKRFLFEVKTEYDSLEHYIEDVDKTLAATELNSRSLAGVLRRMLNDLNASLERIQETISNLTKTVESPEFVDKQRKILENKLQFIQSRYLEIFNNEAFPSKGLLIMNSGHLFNRERTQQGYDLNDNYKLSISLDTNISEALASIPLNTRNLDLSGNQLGAHHTTEIMESFKQLACFNINALDLSGNILQTKSPGELSQIMSCLPSSLLDLNLTWNSLGSESNYKLASVLQNLPKGLKILNLSHTNLAEKASGAKVGESLRTIFKQLPTSLESLSISNNNLSMHTSEELQIGFLGLPQNLRLLDLSGNNFDTRYGPKLAKALKSLPPKLEAIDLSANSLGEIDIIGLQEIFMGLPPLLRRIDLSGNNLNKKNSDQLAKLLGTLKQGLKRLIISRNYLGEMHVDHLSQGLTAIPKTIEELDISFNNLSIYEGESLVKLAHSLCCDLKKLSLYGNNLGAINGNELVIFIQNLPKSIESLNLSRNDLSQLTPDEIRKLMINFPRNIKKLSINHNDFGSVSIKTTYQLFENLPETVTDLEFRNNRLGEKSCDEICQLFSLIPGTLQVLSLDDNRLSEKRFEELKKILQHLPKTLKTLKLSQNHLKVFSREQYKELLLSIPEEIPNLVLDGKFITPKNYKLINQVSHNQNKVNQKINYTPLIAIGVASTIAGIIAVNMMIYQVSWFFCLALLMAAITGVYQSYHQLNKLGFFESQITGQQSTHRLSL